MSAKTEKETKDIQIQILKSGVDLDQLEKEAEKKPFPYIMLMLAWIKDTIDALSLGFLSLITTPLFFMIFLFWFWGRGFLIRKILWKKFFRRLFATSAFKAIPLINIAPVTILLVVVVHSQENKIVKVMEAMLSGEYGEMRQMLEGIT